MIAVAQTYFIRLPCIVILKLMPFATYLQICRVFAGKLPSTLFAIHRLGEADRVS